MDKEEMSIINLKLETKEVKSKIIKLSSKLMVIETPYFLFSEYGKEGIKKIWTRNKWKIVLWCLYKVTRINWFIKKYNKIQR
jgi:hypothetical protein